MLPVHLTQGPPGTGKSYLGVVIVRALMVIRSLWMSQCPEIGNFCQWEDLIRKLSIILK